MTKIITPPDIKKVDGPIIFLAGPIQGTHDWQKEAIEIISSLNKEITVASPRKEYLENEFIYEKQVDWETHHLGLAAKKGVILFWLAKEDKVVPGRAYAQTSRFELGEWKARSQLGLAKLVVGIEDGFSNSRYIRRRLMQDCPSVPLSENLEETCANAVKLIS